MRALAVTLIGIAALAQTPAKNPLNEGKTAFQAGRYAEAADLLQQAVNASPADVDARLYLARALMLQYVPGDESPRNLQLAVSAEREFQAVLGLQPDNPEALESIASLHYLRAQGNRAPAEKSRALDEAAYWYQKIVSVKPDHKTAHYSLGVIAWAKFYPELMQARNKLGMKPEDPGPLTDATVRTELRSRMLQTVNDGMRSLERALEIDPAYDDAMAYLNLLYRERADLYDTAEEYKRDVEIADSWVQRALETKKAKEQQAYARGSAAPGTIRFESRQMSPPVARQGVVGGIIGSQPGPVAVPPPPPPPPPGADGRPGVPRQIRVGGDVQAAKLIEKPEPLYPAEAVQARIQGTVRFDALIMKDGTIGNLTLVSGHPLFVPSATEAVRRYRYQPTLLNGEPVEVVTQVEVSFLLPQ